MCDDDERHDSHREDGAVSVDLSESNKCPAWLHKTV